MQKLTVENKKNTQPDAEMPLDFTPTDPSHFVYSMSKNGEPVVLPIVENTIRAMEILPSLQGHFRHNNWTLKAETNFGSDEWRALQDFDYILIKREVVNAYPFYGIRTATPGYIKEGVLNLVNQQIYDPVLEYLEALSWDGIDRIQDIYKALGAEDEEITKLFLTSWFLGLVKRIIEPGCKYDYVLVLEGAQGIGKSLFFHTLTDIWKLDDLNVNHLETTLAIDTKDFFMQLVGRMVVEFTEGEILSKSSQEALKGVISKRIDTFRPPYKQEIVDVPRRFVFAMTTNQSEYLRDDSGGRRWLPVQCGEKINIDWVKENRDQLFAEAYYRLTVLKEKLPNPETPEAEEVQASRKIDNVMNDEIINWYLGLSETERKGGISLRQVYDEVVFPMNPYSKLDRRMETTLGSCLVGGLFLTKRRVVKDEKRIGLYFPSQKTLKIIKKVIDQKNDELIQK